jgi:protein SCO1
MKRKVALIIILLLSVILSACGEKEIKNAKNWQISDFNYTNQEGKELGLGDLKGKVWVADFIFTSCADVCLPMTANMVKIQKMLKDEGIKDVELISFSVDPEVDNPETLKTFSKQFDADLSNWNFLTGYSQADIEEFARESFKTIVKKPEVGDQVLHGTDFFLVDQEGKIVKYYTGLNEIPFDEIIDDIKTLQ